MSSSFTVRDLPSHERPRERMMESGPEALSSQELLALVLGRGIQGESVLVTAQKLLSRFGSLENILQASLADLIQLRGMGIAKATQLKACLEIARRVSSVRMESTEVVMKPSDVYRLVKAKISQEAKEHFVVLSFDVRNKFLGLDIVGIGILTANIVHPRETFEAAIKRHAAHIIVSHNHPSGISDPSDEDIEMTKRLAEAGSIMGIHVVDHVIVCRDSYYSMAENGLL